MGFTCHARNLKLRGFAATTDKSLKVFDLIAPWLVDKLKLEMMEDLGIEKTFCTGPIRERNKPPSRNILMIFCERSIAVKILAMARIHGYLLYQDQKIQGFPDLPAETILLESC